MKFLSEIGGGRVSGFRGKDIVLVEDEDGFEVPMQVAEVVLVSNDENYDTANMVKKKTVQPSANPASTHSSTRPVDSQSVTVKTEGSKRSAAPLERRDGDQLSVYLSFVPVDVKELTQTRFEAFLVNDSNYYFRYAYYSAEGSSWRLRACGEVEPNTQEYLEEFGRDILNELERVCVQAVAYKRDKPFLLKPALDVTLRIDPVKFYKLHTFTENDFFEQPALVYTLIEKDRAARPLVVDAKQLKGELYKK